jgi:hypothetical protein
MSAFILSCQQLLFCLIDIQPDRPTDRPPWLCNWCLSLCKCRTCESIVILPLFHDSTMEDIVQIVRQIGQQQAHNAYYRDCYSLFKLLQELTEHTFTELQRLYKSGTERSTNSVHQLLRNFQNTICNLVERACEAQAECEEFCSVNESHSARVVFEPIRRMYTNPQASLQGTR